MTRRVIVFAANRGYALSSSRSGLIEQLLDAGWRVVLATADDAQSRALCALGAGLEPVRFARSGMAPASDAAAYRRLAAIYRLHRPAIVQHYHAKPVILGSLAARRALGQEVRIVNTITGLGKSLDGRGLRKWITGLGYKLAGRKADKTVFQNSDDRALFLANNWSSESRSRLIVSAGVDMSRFTPGALQASRPFRVVMVARLLKQKGIGEFAAVAESIRRRGYNVEFALAGEADPADPDAVSMAWLKSHADVEYAGRVEVVEDFLKNADVFLFPSYYREGSPRVLLEAAAMALPIVAFDVPGVRELVEDGETGYLVPKGDMDQLTDRTLALINSGELRRRLGEAGRRRIKTRFDVKQINNKYLDLYRELGATGV